MLSLVNLIYIIFHKLRGSWFTNIAFMSLNYLYDMNETLTGSMTPNIHLTPVCNPICVLFFLVIAHFLFDCCFVLYKKQSNFLLSYSSIFPQTL